jgi:hypothetical protein
VHQLRSFLGLVNYFRKFIQAYASTVSPLTNLLSTKAQWVWGPEQQSAFDAVKQALMQPPVLALPDFSKPFEVVCDACGTGLGAVLLQEGRPVAFESRKLSPAEQNYSTTEQELLAVVHALRTWRCYLEGSEFTVVTDHHPNTFLQTQPHLSRRQAGWSELLQANPFTWVYRPGRQNVADPLSRHPVHQLSVMVGGSVLRALQQPSLPGASLDASTLEAALAAPNSEASPDAPPAATSLADVELPLSEFELSVQASYAHDPWFADADHTSSFELHNGLWYTGEQQLVLPVGDLRTKVISLCHSMPWSGHFGVKKTLHAVQREFFWPGMSADVTAFVRQCPSCQLCKARNTAPPGLLQPLPVPDGKWHSISMDWVTHLPVTKTGFTAVCVFVDRLTKMCHLIPCHDTDDATATAHLLLTEVVRLHGMPREIVSDRDPRLTSVFWSSLCEVLRVTPAMSTAYHPQTDGQTERVNRVMEDVLRHFVSPRQDDWDRWLPLVEFSINNAVHESTGFTPFFLNYGVNPLTPFAATLVGGKHTASRAQLLQHRHKVRGARAEVFRSLRLPDGELRVPAVTAFQQLMQHSLETAKQSIAAAQQRQKRAADAHRSDVTLNVGDEVLLSTANLHLKSHGTRKLLPRWIGPFAVTHQINPVAYRIKLPPELRIHDVFHISVLKPFRADGSMPAPPVPEVIDGELEFEVEAILAHKDVRRGRSRKQVRQFLIKWAGYGIESNSWEPADCLTNCPEKLEEYYSSHPDARPSVVHVRGRTAAASSPAAAPVNDASASPAPSDDEHMSDVDASPPAAAPSVVAPRAEQALRRSTRSRKRLRSPA